MKIKTINSVICKKFDDWLSSIKNEELKKDIESNSIITGGCIASMLLKEDVKDFDVYFTNKQTVKKVAEYYLKEWILTHPEDSDGYVLDGADCDKIDDKNVTDYKSGGAGLNMTEDRIKIIFKSRGVVKEEGALSDEDEIEEYPDAKPEVDPESKPKYRPVYITNNSITLSQKIQIVLRFYGDPETIHQHYDYVHCTNYWTSKERKVTTKKEALESLLSKTLVYIGSKYPICSVIRSRKFIKRGWSVNAGQYLKMAFQISKLDLENINVLEDQLIGVDVAYFGMLIDALKQQMEKAKEENKEFRIDYNYIATIIDKIF